MRVKHTALHAMSGLTLCYTLPSGNVWQLAPKPCPDKVKLNQVGYLPKDGGFEKRNGLPIVASVEWFESAIANGTLQSITIPTHYLR